MWFREIRNLINEFYVCYIFFIKYREICIKYLIYFDGLYLLNWFVFILFSLIFFILIVKLILILVDIIIEWLGFKLLFFFIFRE